MVILLTEPSCWPLQGDTDPGDHCQGGAGRLPAAQAGGGQPGALGPAPGRCLACPPARPATALFHLHSRRRRRCRPAHLPPSHQAPQRLRSVTSYQLPAVQSMLMIASSNLSDW